MKNTPLPRVPRYFVNNDVIYMIYIDCLIFLPSQKLDVIISDSLYFIFRASYRIWLSTWKHYYTRDMKCLLAA